MIGHEGDCGYEVGPIGSGCKWCDDPRWDAARLLIQQGRAWLTLTESDIERGARAVKNDPYYRKEIAHSARLHASYVGPQLLQRVIAATGLLDGKP